MKHPITSAILIPALLFGPVLRATAQNAPRQDEVQSDQQFTNKEKLFTGVVVGGLAVLAAKAFGKDDDDDDDDDQQARDDAKKKSSSETTTRVVKITDARGTTPITLKRLPTGGYVGPKGEYYSELPSSDRLAKVYGLPKSSTPAPKPAATSKTPLQAAVNQGAVVISRNGKRVSVCRTSLPNIEKMAFISNQEFIVVKSRAERGLAMVERFATATGTLTNQVVASSIVKNGPTWTRGFGE